MKKKVLSLIFSVLLFTSLVNAQTADVSVALSEQFFDTLLDAIFKNFNAPEFPLASNNASFQMANSRFYLQDKRAFMPEYKKAALNFQDHLESGIRHPASAPAGECDETIRLEREIDGVKTAVRFRDGKIYAPIAFSGSYNPPLVGCINFQGWAETNIELEYNRQSQKLTGRVRVLSVNLGGATSLASGILSRLVQSSIDKKINPIEILQAEKLSFVVPIQNANGSLKMKAVGVRHEISNAVLNITITYEFSKGS